MIKHKPVIVCEAIPFGFGPAAILKSIIDKMLSDFEIIIVSSGSTYSYFSSLNYKCILCSSYDKNEMLSVLKNIKRIDWVFSVENERIIEIARSLNIKTAYVNVFEFIWSLNDQCLLTSDLYIIYNLFETQKQLEVASKSSNTVFFLKPEIQKTKNSSANKQGVLIHLGGLNSNCISNEHQFIYAEIIITALRNFIDSYKDIKVVTNNELCFYLSKKFTKLKKIKFMTLNSNEFSKILNSSEYYFTTPGIYSTLQGFHEKAITHLLLPANYTQIFQLDGFNKLSTIKYPTFEHLFENEAFSLSVNEKEGLREITIKLRKIKEDARILDRYIELLSNITNEKKIQQRLDDQNKQINVIKPNTHELIKIIRQKSFY